MYFSVLFIVLSGIQLTRHTNGGPHKWLASKTGLFCLFHCPSSWLRGSVGRNPRIACRGKIGGIVPSGKLKCLCWQNYCHSALLNSFFKQYEPQILFYLPASFAFPACLLYFLFFLYSFGRLLLFNTLNTSSLNTLDKNIHKNNFLFHSVVYRNTERKLDILNIKQVDIYEYPYIKNLL